jgi:hypothetical protein
MDHQSEGSVTEARRRTRTQVSAPPRGFIGLALVFTVSGCAGSEAPRASARVPSPPSRVDTAEAEAPEPEAEVAAPPNPVDEAAEARPAAADPRAAHFARRTATLDASNPAEDAAKMASQRMLSFLTLEEDRTRSRGPLGFRDERDRDLVARYGARPMPETGPPLGESHQRYIEAARRYVLAYNLAIRKYQEEQEETQADTDERAAKKAKLRKRFDDLGCVVLGIVRNVRRRGAGYDFELRFDQPGACLAHDGHRCTDYEVRYVYRDGRIEDPQGIYRQTHENIVGVEITAPRTASSPGVPTLRTSRACYRLYDQIERIGAL